MNDKFEAVHEVRIDLSHLDAKQEQIRGRIDRAFYTDVFIPILNDKRNQRATAAEIAQIGEERLLSVGPVLERLNEDVLNPLIDNKFLLMMEAGLIPPAPPELQGMPLKVEYISIMAQAQKTIGLSSLDNLLRFASQVVAVDPTAIQKINTHEIIDQYADALGVAAKVINSDDKVAEIQAAAAKQQQQKQQVENVTQLSGAAKNLSQADTSNPSLLSSLLDKAKAGELVKQ